MNKIKEVSDNKLEQIKGGGSSAIWISIGITAVVIFISSIIEGIAHPKSCEQ